MLHDLNASKQALYSIMCLLNEVYNLNQQTQKQRKHHVEDYKQWSMIHAIDRSCNNLSTPLLMLLTFL